MGDLGVKEDPGRGTSHQSTDAGRGTSFFVMTAVLTIFLAFGVFEGLSRPTDFTIMTVPDNGDSTMPDDGGKIKFCWLYHPYESEKEVDKTAHAVLGKFFALDLEETISSLQQRRNKAGLFQIVTNLTATAHQIAA